MKQIRVAFWGSSINNYTKDIRDFLECLFLFYDHIDVFNGGYQGTMSEVASIGKEIAKKNGKTIYVQGVLFDGYLKDPLSSHENVPNSISDSFVSTSSIGSRVQTMIELSNIFVALPGQTGTLQEIIQAIETIRYGMKYRDEEFQLLFLHSYWKDPLQALYEHGTISSRIYPNVLNTFFPFGEDFDTKRIALESRIKNISKLSNVGGSALFDDAVNVNHVTVKRLIDNSILHNGSKLVEVPNAINRVITKSYFNSDTKNLIIGLDIALKESEGETGRLYRLESIGTPEYIKALEVFLNQFESVIDTEGMVNKWYEIDNPISANANQLFYKDYLNSKPDGSTTSTIDDWIKTLKDNSLGKSLYWTSIKDRNYHLSAFLTLDCFLPEDIKGSIERVVNQFLLSFMLIDSSEEYIKKIYYSTFKASIAEIINRNMAHHITAHVSNRATIDKVMERVGLDSSFLFEDEKLQNNKEIKYSEFKRLNKKSFRNFETVKDLLNIFNQYRDERSEYLAYITNFSSPFTAKFFQDVIRPFVENTLLMDNIAANENLNYITDEKGGKLLHNRLRLKIRIKEGDIYKPLYALYKSGENPLYCSEDLEYFRTFNHKGEYPYERVELIGPRKDDLEVSLPGTLGKHALYSILENFIRNSAKHGGAKKDAEGLDIFILIAEEEDSYEVILTDNCSYIKSDKRKINLNKFNESIKSPIIEKKDLGLIDMKVNACLLAGKLLNDENCKDSFEAIDYEGKLAYKFNIAKPQKAVFIGEFATGKLSESGFFFYHTMKEYRESSKTSKAFQFAVLGKEVFEEERLSSELPARVLNYDEVKLNIEDTESLELQLYCKWVEFLRGGNDPTCINLFLQQNDGENPTKSLKTNSKDFPNFHVHSKDDLDRGKPFSFGRFNVLFDRHGESIERELPISQSLVDPNNAWILIDKNNPDFDYIFRYDLKNKSKLLPLELEEAGRLKVLIIDERVAEQSVRVIHNDINARKLSTRDDFKKPDGSSQLTLFDTAWAANVFMATHLNDAPLKQTIDERKEHKLDVTFCGNNITLKSNVAFSLHGGKGSANRSKTNQKEYSFCADINITPDIIVIHRTKLKELIEEYKKKNEDFVEMLKEGNPYMQLIVTTGSGTTHGIDGSFKVLPYTTLCDLVLGKRIQKLRLSKTLLQLTKNAI